ncbi:MAG: phosphoribosyl-AMP cyclohydrolase [Candidatus Hodgkinia cicadicola]
MSFGMGNVNLIPVIVMDFYSKEVLMLSYVDELCFKLSLRTGIAHYWSRGRACVWVKGASSGNLHVIQAVRMDCGAKSLCFDVLVLGDGLSCHTRRPSCFYRTIWKRG